MWRLTALAALVLALGGCGGGSKDDAAPATTLDLSVVVGPEVRRSTTTARPGTSTTAESKVGSRSSPIPLGTEARFTNGWAITVLDVTQDGTAAVMAENMFNDAPADGEQFYLVHISTTFSGNDSRSPLGDLRFSALDSGNTQIREGECGVTPASFDSFTEVFTGGSIDGNLCFAVPSATVASMVMYVDAGTFNGQRLFFALA